jgi:hypothetical protein
MKSALLVAALMLGSTAVAQPMQPSGRTVADQSQSSGPQGLTQQGTDPEGQPCTPAGFNQAASAYPPCGATGGTQMTGAMATTGGTTSAGGTASMAPACSRTVTDGCLQTYERGMRPRR